MGGGLPKPAEILEAVGDDSEGYRKDRRNGALLGINVQGDGAFGVTLWKRELGGDWGDAQGPDGIPPSGGATYHGDDREMWGRQRVGVSNGRGGDGISEDPPHRSIHKEAGDNHSREFGLPACLCIMHGGGENYGDNIDDTLVGSRRGKLSREINEEAV